LRTITFKKAVKY